ncbi:MAG: nucleotidyltransferase family protein [Gemmatimonadota bacterium]
MTSTPVDGVILAAGRSARMEQPKALLTVGPDTFLERAAQTLRQAGCRRIWVVAGSDATWLDLAAGLGLELVINAEPSSEQVDSLRLVLRALPPDTAGVLVLPVDLPLVQEQTATAMMAAFQAAPCTLVLPFHNTVAGHPVLLGSALFDEVLNTELEEGIRTLIMSHARDLCEVKVDDPGILIDIDTPDDYSRSIEQQ